MVDRIVFKIRNNLREKGLLIMRQDGKYYSGNKHPSFHSEEGERIDFYCPICMQSLDAPADENLVQVLKIEPDGFEHTVFFSRIHREHGVYEVSEMLHSDH